MIKESRLSDDLFRIDNVSCHGDSVQATVRLNSDHDVFKGHFPGNPILPGVFIIQITKELVESRTGTKLLMSKADTIKYLSFINPGINNPVEFDISINDSVEKTVKFCSTVSSGTNVFCRLKGEFTRL